MVEEKTPKVVIPLTHESGEHKGEQNHFRAERRQNGISVRSSVNENTGLQGLRMSCFGLSTVERWRKDEREDRLMRTRTIPVKSANEASISELARRYSNMKASYSGS
jgi:hypothetical protein